MQSYLIVGGKQEQRKETADKIISRRKVSRFDQIQVEEANIKSIGIDQIRQLQHQLNLKPYHSKVKAALILSAEKLTIPAQNAMLKMLEEPPQNTLIILASPRAGLLLPTIISRCQIIRLPFLNQKIYNPGLITLNSILKSGVGERLKIAGEIASSREKAIEFCQSQTIIWRNKMKKAPTGVAGAESQVKTIRALQKALYLLETNTNPKLILESLLLQYPA